MSHRYYTAFARTGIPHGGKVGFMNFPHNLFLFSEYVNKQKAGPRSHIPDVNVLHQQKITAL